MSGRTSNKYQTGFTLLELLVVIAIIGILAAVVIASLGSSRDKAANSSTLSQVQEYIKAVELFYFDNDATYPNVTSGFDCLGQYEAEGVWNANECWAASSPQAETLSALDPYMSTRPEGNTVLVGSVLYRGEIYRDICTQDAYEIRYMLVGANQECAAGGDFFNTSATGKGYTYCQYIGGKAEPLPDSPYYECN